MIITYSILNKYGQALSTDITSEFSSALEFTEHIKKRMRKSKKAYRCIYQEIGYRGFHVIHSVKYVCQ